jgi:hypothetical protein
MEGGRQFNTLEDLRSAIVDCWDQISVEDCQNLILFMPKRIFTLINKNSFAYRLSKLSLLIVLIKKLIILHHREVPELVLVRIYPPDSVIFLSDYFLIIYKLNLEKKF